jgi:hypothetical protein
MSRLVEEVREPGVVVAEGIIVWRQVYLQVPILLNYFHVWQGIQLSCNSVEICLLGKVKQVDILSRTC